MWQYFYIIYLWNQYIEHSLIYMNTRRCSQHFGSLPFIYQKSNTVLCNHYLGIHIFKDTVMIVIWIISVFKLGKYKRGFWHDSYIYGIWYISYVYGSKIESYGVHSFKFLRGSVSWLYHWQFKELLDRCSHVALWT